MASHLHLSKSANVTLTLSLASRVLTWWNPRPKIMGTANWTPRRLAKLGKTFDIEVARQLGVHQATVMNKRKKLGIPACGPIPVKWTAPLLAKLGKVPDTEIALLLGVHQATVSVKRRKLGIALHGERQEVKWTRKLISRLGKESDRRIARSLGVGVHRIQAKRYELGIPWYLPIESPAPNTSVTTFLKSHLPAQPALLKFLGCGWLGLVMTVAHAAPDAPAPAHINEIQKAVLNELNVARTTPLKYVEYLKDRRRGFKGKIFSAPGGIRVTTREGVVAIDDAIEALSKQAPLTALQFSGGLALAALDHVQDTGPKGLVSHDGTDGSNPFARISRYGEPEGFSGECISFGRSDARQIVLTLIIDDGVASRGHRLSIFTKEFRLAGIARGPHKTFKDMCVIDFACDFKEDKQAIRKRLEK